MISNQAINNAADILSFIMSPEILQQFYLHDIGDFNAAPLWWRMKILLN